MPIPAAFCLFLAGLLIVVLMVKGVQKAKKNGTYLQPDNPAEYVKSVDGLTSLTYEGETICPEEEDEA